MLPSDDSNAYKSEFRFPFYLLGFSKDPGLRERLERNRTLGNCPLACNTEEKYQVKRNLASFREIFRKRGLRNEGSVSIILVRALVGIVQLARTPDCGSGGRRFESDYPPQRTLTMEVPVRRKRSAG